VAIKSVAGRLGMNPETLPKWFRPVEVNSHRPTAPRRPLRRLNDQESITAGWLSWQDTHWNASHRARPPSNTRPTTILRPTDRTQLTMGPGRFTCDGLFGGVLLTYVRHSYPCFPQS
jgi:transposase-like protein